MAEYITVPIKTDPDDLKLDAFQRLSDLVPGWQPAESNFETIHIAALAEMVAEARDVASDVPAAIFRYFGRTLAQLPPIDAVAATATSTWTVKDTAGYTIPAGTLVGVRDSAGNLLVFATTLDRVVPNGRTTVGAVALEAQEPGAAGTALGIAGAPVELIDALDYVTAITLVAPTSGGIDAEDDDTYLNRLTTELQLQAPRPILPRDFAALSQNIPGVGRALALDGYIPGTPPQTGQQRAVTVALVDIAGQPVSQAIRTAVQSYLQARREVNFLVSTMDPTYTLVAVTFTAIAGKGWDPTDVHDRAIAALQAFLSPATWGTVAAGEARQWINVPLVRYLEVATVLNNVAGLDYVTALTLGVQGAAMAATDTALAGDAPLPGPGTMTGTLTTP